MVKIGGCVAMWACVCVWACVWVCVAGFNVDLASHVTHHSDQRESMFGFAVAQHMDGGTARMLVGAPLYDTEQRAIGVRKAGAVLSCDANVPDSCSYVPFDTNGNNVHPLGQQLDNKTGQWFGATVRSSGPDGVVVACAPRYVWFTENLKRREPVGTCYVARNALTDFQEFSPCRTRHWGYHRQGSCQAGFDAIITENGKRLYIGAPGAFYWQGQCWTTKLEGQIHSYNLVTRNEYEKTWEGPAEGDDQYLGYSVAVGDFNGDGTEDVALGVPKGLNYTGKAVQDDPRREEEEEEDTEEEEEEENTRTGKRRKRKGKKNKRMTTRKNTKTQKDNRRRRGRRKEEQKRKTRKQKREVRKKREEEKEEEEEKLTWQGWFEKTGFLFQPAKEKGYHSLSLPDSFTPERPSYGASSLAVGAFSGGASRRDVALGTPRGPDETGALTGKVALFTEHLRPIQNITGYQLGSYFGYCLAVLDFNRDGLDDIVIGAPLYTDYEDREMKFEVGRVHVVLQNRLHRFRQVVTFTGEVSQGRFGLSLTSLGDINQDGIQDMAVGAPYGGPDGSGAVFIYHGFEIRTGQLISDELKKPSQVILARDVGLGVPMASFGWALSGGLDVDSNQYPDLLVGATHANAAVVLKSRPIVSLLNHTLTFLSKEEIDIEVTSAANREKDCRTRSGRLVSCVDLEFCVGYGGLAVPAEIELEVKYQLDGEVKDPRLFFMVTDTQGLSESLRLVRGRPRCRVHKTYVSPSVADKLTPLGAEVRLALVEGQSGALRLPRSIRPVLNQKQNLSVTGAIAIKNNCGPDDMCVPDLELNVHVPDTFTFGKKEQLEVVVRVMNHGEDAYQASVFLPEPPGLQYNIFEARDNTSVTCSPRYTAGTTTLVCDIGNPLKMLTGVHFAVFFHPQPSTLVDDRIQFDVVANSTIAEAAHTSDDNFVQKIVMLGADVDLVLYGSSTPENIAYNKSLYQSESYRHEEDLGPEVLHIFAVSNNGASRLTQAEFVILWPLQALNGESYLLYLLEQPHVTGPGSCAFVPDTNPMQLELNKETSTTRLLKLQSKEEEEKERREEEKRITLEEEGRILVEEERTYTESGGGGGGGEVVEEEDGERKETSGGGKKETYYEETSFTTYSTGGGGGGGGGGRRGGEGGGANYSSSSSTYSSSSSSSKTFTSSSSSSSSYGSSSSGSSSSSSSYGYSGHHSRRTREVDGSQEWEDTISNCGMTHCIRIRCTAGPLEEQDIVFVYVRSRLVLATLQEYPYDDVSISSRMVARVTSLPYGVNPRDLEVKTKDVTTPVSPAKSLDEAPAVPWWVIILAVLAGILILLLIILILWKCGYFKRHRPEQSGNAADDAQPLNPPKSRNGHPCNPYTRPMYPGDEAL
ncbi:integrin alpha-PS2-like isoform X2 [Portunus trituberculatus]|uniref:integrin alpha-PS2-like isoform X2 n=1 Tax=Portunus trituberculatus TaxID=210409 RepID=UPI001E1CC096|nr:integrin alpha-PS2-like isoform X2 [Portunus trituberculatus]